MAAPASPIFGMSISRSRSRPTSTSRRIGEVRRRGRASLPGHAIVPPKRREGDNALDRATSGQRGRQAQPRVLRLPETGDAATAPPALARCEGISAERRCRLLDERRPGERGVDAGEAALHHPRESRLRFPVLAKDAKRLAVSDHHRRNQQRSGETRVRIGARPPGRIGQRSGEIVGKRHLKLARPRR